MEPVLELRDVGRGDLAVAGGKGANLGELVRAGYAVPDGFVITTAVYERATAGIAVSSTDAGARRDAVADAALPDDMRDAVVRAYERLGAGAVAVRSSATAEDLPGAAFAGQQETFLNVWGSSEVLDAVRRCWASLWSDRAIAYRAQRGIPDDEVQIAVVVQALVAADIAGVMFTADPVTGERDRIVIDASPGLGEAVVSGLVTPQHVMLDARDRLVGQRGGNAEVVIRAADGGGTREEHASADGTQLTTEQARRLAAVGRSIAARFGAPQDIEWAFEGERLWVLQARPLTALPPAPRRVNAVRRMMGSIVAELLPVRPYPLDMSTWTLRGHGRILTRMLAEIPGVNLDLGRMLPEAAGVVDELVPPEPRPSARTLTAPARAIRKARRFDTREWTGDPRFARFEREIAELRSLEPRSLDWVELVGIPHRVLSSLDGLITLRIDYLPHAGLSLLRLRLRLGALGLRGEAGPLSRGLQTRTSQANVDLGALALTVASRPEWLQAFRESDPDRFADRLASDERLAGLREPIAAYLSEYGHREVRSAFLMSEPTWGETPALLHAGIAGLLDRPEAAGEPGYAIAAVAVERLRSYRRIRLTNSAPSILAAAEAARAGIAFREDTHFHATRGLPVLRGALLEAGRRLADAGVLDTTDDVMHLRLAEITALAGPEAAGGALRERALARKARRASYAGGPLISPATLYPHRRGTGDALVAGTPAGGGRASGAVRVVRGPSDFASLRAGEVLVCPYTNPSWTPLFERAAAVVVDSGGLASRAAIVAREYGIPAVMGTGIGTTVLHDGDAVTVDGDAGHVVPAR
ncbi:PEP/pyruvate-binding domain-containing protein [Microbacterium pumilum]|uniref:Phosphoenolpyruvate synthase n=1 Tax=Microbacterium pumilum TaxID=344165 RepID=A0ABP5DXJ4_9MICO